MVWGRYSFQSPDGQVGALASQLAQIWPCERGGPESSVCSRLVTPPRSSFFSVLLLGGAKDMSLAPPHS